MDFTSWNPEVVIWGIIAALACLTFLLGVRKRSNAKSVMAINDSMGTFGGFLQNGRSDFDRTFNQIGDLAVRQGLRRMVLSAIVLLICGAYFSYRNNLF